MSSRSMLRPAQMSCRPLCSWPMLCGPCCAAGWLIECLTTPQVGSRQRVGLRLHLTCQQQQRCELRLPWWPRASSLSWLAWRLGRQRHCWASGWGWRCSLSLLPIELWDRRVFATEAVSCELCNVPSWAHTRRAHRHSEQASSSADAELHSASGGIRQLERMAAQSMPRCAASHAAVDVAQQTNAQAQRGSSCSTRRHREQLIARAASAPSLAAQGTIARRCAEARAGLVRP